MASKAKRESSAVAFSSANGVAGPALGKETGAAGAAGRVFRSGVAVRHVEKKLIHMALRFLECSRL